MSEDIRVSPGGGRARSLLTQTSVYLLASLVQMGSALLVIPIITRVLGQDEYGYLAAILVIVQVLVAIGGFGLPGVVARPIYDRVSDASRQSGSLALTVLVLSAATLLVAGATSPVWAPLTGRSLAPAVLVGLMLIVFSNLVQSVLGVARADGRALRFVVISGLAGPGGQALGLCLLILVDRSVGWFFVGYVTAQILAAMVGLPARWKESRPSWPTIQEFRAALSLGVPLVGHVLALMLLATGDRLIIEAQVGLAQVGRYHVAYQVGAALIALLGAVNNAWAPLIYGADPTERWHVQAVTTDIVLGVTMIAVGFGGLLLPVVLDVIVPADYGPADLVPVARVVMASSIPFVLYLSAGHVLFQERRTGIFTVATPLVAALNLGANWILIDRYGLVAAAWTTFGSYLSLAVAMQWRARRVAPLRRPTGLELAAPLVSAAFAWQHHGSIALVTAVIVSVAGVVVAARGWSASHRHGVALA